MPISTTPGTQGNLNYIAQGASPTTAGGEQQSTYNSQTGIYIDPGETGTGVGSNAAENANEALGDAQAPGVVAPGSLYAWQGPSGQQALATASNIASQGPAQINANAGNKYLDAAQAQQNSQTGVVHALSGENQALTNQNKTIGGLNNQLLSQNTDITAQNKSINGLDKNVTAQNATIGQQNAQIGQANRSLQATIAGTGQSAADVQLQQGQQANLAAQLAASRSATGPGAALAAYQAAAQGSASNQATNVSAAAQRAQESAAAQGQLSTNMGLQNSNLGLQSQNLNQLTANAGLQDQNLALQNSNIAQESTNAGLQNSNLGLQGQNLGTAGNVLNQQQSANLTEASAQQQLAQNQAQLDQAQTQYNQGVLQGGENNAIGIGTQIGNLGIAQGGQMTQAEGINAGVGVASAQLQGQYAGAITSGAGSALAGLSAGAGQLASDIRAKEEVQPQGAGAFNPGASRTDALRSQSNVGVAVDQAHPQQNDAMAQYGAIGAADRMGVAQAMPLARSNSGIAFGRPPQNNAHEPAPAIASGLGTSMQSLVSDENVKGDVSPAGDNAEPLAALDAVSGPQVAPLSGIGSSTAAPQMSGGTTPAAPSNGGGGQTHSNAGGSGGIGGTGITGGQLASYAGTAAMLFSDRRAKLIVPEGKHTISDEFLNAAADSEATYRYKDPNLEPTSRPTGGKYLGIMAQRLQQVPEVGPQLVKDGPRGKYLELGPALSATMAGVGRLNERLQHVERYLGAARGA